MAFNKVILFVIDGMDTVNFTLAQAPNTLGLERKGEGRWRRKNRFAW